MNYVSYTSQVGNINETGAKQHQHRASTLYNSSCFCNRAVSEGKKIRNSMKLLEVLCMRFQNFLLPAAPLILVQNHIFD